MITKEQLVKILTEHETRYRVAPDAYRWDCACGIQAELKTYEECHAYTREHWAEKILSLVVGERGGNAKASPGSAFLACEFCDIQASFIIKGRVVCEEHRNRVS